MANLADGVFEAGERHRPFFDPRMALYNAKGYGDPRNNMYEMKYGSAESAYAPQQQAAGRGARWQINASALLLAVAVPFALFAGPLVIMSFGIYDHHPGMALLLIASCVFLVLVVGAFAAQAKRDEMKGGSHRGTWHFVIICTGLLGIFLGTSLGYVNREWNTKHYYDYVSLRKIVDVDPGAVHGQEVLDAGEIDFKMGTQVDIKLHSVWQHGHSYCVAPLTSSDGAALASYDLWAVGKDCCSSSSDSFLCGTAPGTATGGLRVIDTDDIQHYQLALQQAVAAHSIQARRPIFLYMMPKPYQRIKAYLDEGQTFALVSGIAFLLMQIVLVAVQSRTFGTGRPSGYADPEEGPEHQASGIKMFRSQPQ